MGDEFLPVIKQIIERAKPASPTKPPVDPASSFRGKTSAKPHKTEKIPLTDKISKEFKKCRENFGITMRDMALLLKICKTTYFSIENGTHQTLLADQYDRMKFLSSLSAEDKEKLKTKQSLPHD